MPPATGHWHLRPQRIAQFRIPVEIPVAPEAEMKPKGRLGCFFLVILTFPWAVAASAAAEEGAVSRCPEQLKILGLHVGAVPRRVEYPQVIENRIGFPTEEFVYRAEFTTLPAPGKTYRDYYPSLGTVRQPPRVDPTRVTKEIASPFAALMVRNDSGKTIERVEWEFTFPHFKRGREVIYYRAVDRVRIEPGEATVLARKLPHDACSLGSDMIGGIPHLSRTCGSKSTGSYPLQARIKLLKYADGTVANERVWRTAHREVGFPSFFEAGVGPVFFCISP